MYKDEWLCGDYDEHLGYDCMTGGIRVGPVVLDGVNYGQDLCEPISPEALKRMTRDAHMISAMYETHNALEQILIGIGMGWDLDGLIEQAQAALKKGRGDPDG